jgi:hypothetical protein
MEPTKIKKEEFMVWTCLLYALHYVIFRDMHHILIFMMGEFAFLPCLRRAQKLF